MENITKDQLFLIVWNDNSPYTCNFSAYRIEGWDESTNIKENKDLTNYGFADNCQEPVPLFQKIDEGSSDRIDLTHNLEEAEVPFLKGTIKWDGCCHLNFDNYIHFCDKQDAIGVGRLIGELYDLAKKMMEDQGTGTMI